VLTRSSSAAALMGVFIARATLAQVSVSQPEFEVASVKLANLDRDLVENHLPNLHAEQGQITFTNIRLQNLIMLAYGLGKGQISIPASLNSALANRYEVAAKLPAGSKREQVPLMLQKLLADRFKVMLHRENKVMPLYALVTSRRAMKLKEASENGSRSGCTRSFATSPPASLAATCLRMSAADIAQATTALAPGYFDRPVVDMTGLTGLYDFTIEWITRGESVNGSDGPTIFTAVEQLGLKLEPRKQSMDIIIVDHAEEKPVEN
jgi:uncharacterized protein (TIGR03435 family)